MFVRDMDDPSSRTRKSAVCICVITLRGLIELGLIRLCLLGVVMLVGILMLNQLPPIGGKLSVQITKFICGFWRWIVGSWWVFSELAAVVKVMSGLFFRHSEVHVFFRGLKALPSIFYVKLVNTNTNASVRCWFDFNGALCMWYLGAVLTRIWWSVCAARMGL